MTSFSRIPSSHPATGAHRAEVLANPGFGKFFTDHMATVRYSTELGWHDAKIEAYRSIELDPAYVDVAVRRWQEMTGEAAVHADTGERFDQRAAEVQSREEASPV